MPLFMDYHQLEGDLTIDDVKEAHKADLANQEKYGVRYLQFWINEKAGMVFCLIEGPNPEACVACHLTSHGNTPCNIQEVEPGFLKLFMGEGLPIDDHHMTLTLNGEADPASRTILVCDLWGVTVLTNIAEHQFPMDLIKTKIFVVDTFTRFNGQFVEHESDDKLVGVFISPINAIRCARHIQDHLLKLDKGQRENSDWDDIFRLALNCGEPLTRIGGFFEAALTHTKRLCMIAEPNQVVLSANLKDLIDMEVEAAEYFSPRYKVLTIPEEDFINQLVECTEKGLSTESFNVNSLCKLIGKSRSQLYRKIIALTGKSPNNFIQEVKMKKAWYLLKSKKGNVAEVALDVGYSNPSHFSKAFRKNFGHTPSRVFSDGR